MTYTNCDWQFSAPADWDEYVLAHPGASAFHTAAAVRIGADAFGLRPLFITSRRPNGQLCGAMPMVEQLILPWTRTLVSLPFCTHGGPLADNDLALAGLIAAAERAAQSRAAKRIVLRTSIESGALKHAASLDKVSMQLELPDSSDQLAKRLGSKLRSQIKRADRAAPSVHTGGVELISDFYTVFGRVMRDLGTPVYPRHFFEAVLDAMGSAASVVVMRVGGQPVSAAILVQWRDNMEVPWACTLRRMNPMSIIMRLYWELLQFAIDRGCRNFDFGRSTKNSGTFRFKEQWGARPRQLFWYSWKPGHESHSSLAGRDARSIAAAVRLWTRLPLPLANFLGPRISPHLPW